MLQSCYERKNYSPYRYGLFLCAGGEKGESAIKVNATFPTIVGKVEITQKWERAKEIADACRLRERATCDSI